MKKIIAKVVRLANKSLYPRIYCVNHNGVEDEAVNLTLCDAVWELNGSPMAELEKLMEDARAEGYVSRNPDFPDMSINDKLIWVKPSFVTWGQICISNENVPEFSIDEGKPQCFTFNQIKITAKFALNFSNEITSKGYEYLVGHQFEIDFPEG